MAKMTISHRLLYFRTLCFPNLIYCFVGAFVASVCCVFYHPCKFTRPYCLNDNSPYINWTFDSFPLFDTGNNLQDTPDEIKRDKLYDKSLSASLPQSKQVLDEILRKQKLVYQQLSAQRSALLQRPDHHLYYAIMTYIPQLICPTQVRLGIVGDGGFTVCNPWVLAKFTDACVLYALDVDNRVLFENEFYDITGRRCEIHCFGVDSKNDRLFSSFNGKFTKGSISDKTDVDNGRYSLLDITSKLNHKNIDVMKVDIEGVEFRALPSFLRNFKGVVCQLLIEVHANWNNDAVVWVRFFAMLERRGYRLYNVDSNPVTARVIQYSYIHLNCFERYGLKQEAVLFRYFE